MKARTLIIVYFGGPIDGLEFPVDVCAEDLDNLHGPLMTDVEIGQRIYHYEALVHYTPTICRYPMNLISTGVLQG